MYCRACGMESRTTDICEWCKKPLPPPPGPQSAAGQPQQGAPPLAGTAPLARPLTEMTPPAQAPLLNGPQPPSQTSYAPPVRTTLTGEVIETPPAAFPTGPPPLLPGGSPAAVDPILSPVAAGLPMAAVTPEAMRGQIENEYESPMGERWEKALA
ncbi:MAG TPA: hypothetical protein VKT32_14570, partial [Chthonomonadaceae bacterium]|nr:hypothetical protein [Chthonomonadaceae bacterium]